MGLRDKVKVLILKKVLNDSTLYDVVTAIRGCDSGSRALKYLFTARIRYLAGLDPVNVEVDVREYGRINLLMIYEALGKVSRTDIHCLDHIVPALDALEKLELIDSKEAEVLREIASILNSVARQFMTRDEAVKAVNKLAEKYSDIIKP